MTLAPNSVIVRTKFCDKFFYYYFSSDVGKSQINNITSKTAMQQDLNGNQRPPATTTTKTVVSHCVLRFSEEKTATATASAYTPPHPFLYTRDSTSLQWQTI